MQEVFVILGMITVPPWMLDEPLSSYQLLVIAGVLLVIAAVLMGVRRKTRIMLESSVVTEELMIYLARIANALEKGEGPNAEQITGNVLRKLEEIANARPNGKVREIPNSMFGREYQE